MLPKTLGAYSIEETGERTQFIRGRGTFRAWGYRRAVTTATKSDWLQASATDVARVDATRHTKLAASLAMVFVLGVAGFSVGFLPVGGVPAAPTCSEDCGPTATSTVPSLRLDAMVENRGGEGAPAPARGAQ
jgi:hypothetical protein